MPLLNPNKARAVISLMLLAFVLLYLVSLFFFQIPIENKDLVNIVLGAILGRLDSIITYYFGDSNDKSNK